MPERGFLIFWIFLLFFSEFSCRGRVWTEFGTKCFSLFLGFYHVLDKNIAGMRFLNFWIFLLFFSEFSCTDWVWTEFGTKIFFLAFSAYLIPFWLKIMPERGFLIFLIFFSEFSYPGRVITEFGTKIFFSLSWIISSCFGYK